MVTKIKKWGNSQGIRLNKSILVESGISIDDDIDIAVSNGVIKIKPLNRIRGKYNINELVKRIPKKTKFNEVDWGESQGNEI